MIVSNQKSDSSISSNAMLNFEIKAFGDWALQAAL